MSFMVLLLNTQVVGEDASMPDVCIAHQLHLECGRLINLYDWMQVSKQAFPHNHRI